MVITADLHGPAEIILTEFEYDIVQCPPLNRITDN